MSLAPPHREPGDDLTPAERVLAGEAPLPAEGDPWRLPAAAETAEGEVEREMRDAVAWTRALSRSLGSVRHDPDAPGRLLEAVRGAWPSEAPVLGGAAGGAAYSDESDAGVLDPAPSGVDPDALGGELAEVDRALGRVFGSVRPAPEALDRMKQAMGDADGSFEPVTDEDAPPAPLPMDRYRAQSPGRELMAAGSDLDDADGDAEPPQVDEDDRADDAEPS